MFRDFLFYYYLTCCAIKKIRFNCQGTVAEATVVLKLNQGSFPKTGCNPCLLDAVRQGFRGSFFVTFLEKQKSKD